MPFARSLVVGLVVIAVVPTVAHAQLRYVWGDTNGNLVTTTTISSIGGTVNMRVYVQDQSVGATTFNSQGGLGNASALMTGVAGNVSILSGTPDVGVGRWELGDTNGSNPPASVKLNCFNISTGRLPDSNGLILLGTVSIRGDAIGSFDITAGDPFPANSGDVTLFLNGQPLDPLNIATLKVIITVVPEPASILIVTASALFFLGRGHFRRRASAKAAFSPTCSSLAV